MEFDATRMMLGAVVGVAAGLCIVLGIFLTQRLFRAGAEEFPGVLSGAGEPHETHHMRIVRWGGGAAILLISVSFFAVVSSIYRPPPLSVSVAPPPNAPVTPAQIDIGGVVLGFVPPAGYCFYPEPQLQEAMALQRTANPNNVVHTVFGDCDQLHAVVASGGRVHDFGMLMTPTALMHQAVDRSTIDRIASQSIDAAKAKETEDQWIKEAEKRLSLQSFFALGPLDRDGNAIYFGYLVRMQNGGDQFDQAIVMAMSSIRGRMISYYLYSDCGKDPHPVLQRLLYQAKAANDQFIALNR